MSRIIYVPQYPTPMRYQEWWFSKLPQEFEKAGFYVLTLGEKYAEQLRRETGDDGMFSPIDVAIDFETMQINEYMSLDLKDDDILFLSDLSFPGLFCGALFHKRPKRMFAYCHATSINKFDYFQSVWMSKYPVEKAHAEMFDVVFVGSHYHELKLNWANTSVVRLPYPPLKFFRGHKKHFIASASRPTPQKVNLELEAVVEEKFGEIKRETFYSWEDYYSFLSTVEVLLITSWEDTFGYQIVDAVLNGCIPLAPSRCAYPELLPPECMYETEAELMAKLEYLQSLEVMPPTPEILCHQEMEDFYKNIIQVMKGEVKDYPF